MNSWTPYTPGPWETWNADNDFTGNKIYGGGRILAETCTHDCVLVTAEEKANALIITAAPELYELLQVLLTSNALADDYRPHISEARDEAVELLKVLKDAINSCTDDTDEEEEEEPEVLFFVGAEVREFWQVFKDIGDGGGGDLIATFSSRTAAEDYVKYREQP